MLAGECFDKNGIPIYPGDLLKSYHFTGARRKKYYLYHIVKIFDCCNMKMESVHGKGGSCLLTQDLGDNAEVISGYGPKGYLDYTDRPKKKS